MLDLKWIRDHPNDLDAGLARRGHDPVSAAILDLDGRRRQAQSELQDLQTARNEASKTIGEAKRKGEDASSQMAEVSRIKDSMAVLEERERTLGAELDVMLAGLPNLPAGDVPDGATILVDAADNQLDVKVKTPQPEATGAAEHAA